ncbi:hypothetical protein DCC62_27060 [candidate division KSB1 bacterium]|nr:MAG: hypothetical protein DCC62_27060 [candidate division KSB1 bacterium]
MWAAVEAMKLVVATMPHKGAELRILHTHLKNAVSRCEKGKNIHAETQSRVGSQSNNVADFLRLRAFA